MKFPTNDEAINFVKDHLKVDPWVALARENKKVLRALVLGDKFKDVLINRIEKIESIDRQIARKKYSKDIRDMFDRVMKPRSSVFSASGGSIHNDVKIRKEEFDNAISEFKGRKSLKKYLSENFFRFEDTDPNGLIYLEYIENEDIYPTYKSIDDIRYYESDGQICKVLLFEPKKVMIEGVSVLKWRLVDDAKEWTIIQDGDNYRVLDGKQNTFNHPFGNVPGVILSDMKDSGSELRVSPLFPIVPLSEDYARDKSIKTVYKFLNGFTRHWMYERTCKACFGTGKNGEEPCGVCGGTGNLRSNDVTDITIVDTPRDKDDAVITPPEGWTQPDLETWTQYSSDLRDSEDLIDSTMWGTKRIKEGGNETATGRFIDVQPVMNKLSDFTDNVEWVHNQLAHWVENWVNGSPKKEFDYHESYGRDYIIESPDSILEKYTKARTQGDNNTILDKLMDEYILARYQSSVILLGEAQKKRQVEPYLHQSITEVDNMFGSSEANKKVLFVKYWQQADKSKEVIELQKGFDTYFQENNTINTNQLNINGNE